MKEGFLAKLGGRKFLFTLLTIDVAALILVMMNKLDGTDWLNLALSGLAVYGIANVAGKAK
jgi:hypothetical protein